MSLYFKSYRNVYDNVLYEMEGTLEHEVHKIIEPKIRERYKNLVSGEYIVPITLVTRP